MSFLLGRPIWRGYFGFSEGKISSNSRCTGHYDYHMFAWHCEAAAARLSGEQESENELLFEDCCFYLTLLWNFRERIQKQHLIYSGDFHFSKNMKCLLCLEQPHGSTLHPRDTTLNVNAFEVETKDAQTPEVPGVWGFIHEHVMIVFLGWPKTSQTCELGAN